MKEKQINVELETAYNSITFVILKPLGTKEPIRTKILNSLSTTSNFITSIKLFPTSEQVYELYCPNGLDQNGKPKPYFMPMIEYFKDKEIEIVFLGSNSLDQNKLIKAIDKKIGFWDPNKSNPGEIRHLMKENQIPYNINTDYDNLIHSPTSLEDMIRELNIFSEELKIIEIKK